MAQPTLIPNCDGARFESLPLDTHRNRCILALDLGTSTGWAIRGHDGLITSGTTSLIMCGIRLSITFGISSGICSAM